MRDSSNSVTANCSHSLDSSGFRANLAAVRRTWNGAALPIPGESGSEPHEGANISAHPRWIEMHSQWVKMAVVVLVVMAVVYRVSFLRSIVVGQ